MRRLSVIGIGAGDPAQITIEAIGALNRADVVFEIERGAQDLTIAREEICRRYLDAERDPRVVRVTEPQRDRTAAAYGAAVQEWRMRRADAWEQAIANELGEDDCGALLVWGDPSLYDSTIAVLDQILERGRVAFEYRVVPGISSLHALTARHRISLNRVGGAVLVTTGRRLTEHGFPAGVDDVVVMLDGGCSFRHVINEPLEIFWGAYLGTQDEILVSGPLATVADQIEQVRKEARERKGWIMDCYLLRRR
jgi:precorrin-6A synthase